jgi:hypothetical protein
MVLPEDGPYGAKHVGDFNVTVSAFKNNFFVFYIHAI